MRLSKPEYVTETVLAVFRTYGRLIDWGDRFVAPFGLTSARWKMLGALALSHQPLTAPQVAASMGVSRQGAQKQLSSLIMDGLVAKHPNPHHQRSPLCQLTPKGTEIYAAIEHSWNAHAEELCADLNLDDILAAQRVLATLYEKHATHAE